MKRELKQFLADAVIVAAADMITDWTTTTQRHPELAEVDPDDAADVVSHWLRTLPGHGWDDRLPDGDWR